MRTKSLLHYAPAVAMWAFVICCFVWGKDILASSVGPSVRIALCVFGILICLRLLFTVVKYVRLALTSKEKGVDMAKQLVFPLVAVAFLVHFIFDTMRFGDLLCQLVN